MFNNEDMITSLNMNSLMTFCINEPSGRYAEICDIPSSHQEAIALDWVNDNDYTTSWTANDYAPDLEFSNTSNYPHELMFVSVDKRGGLMGLWYSKDCVYHEEVYIDSIHIVAGLEGYTKTVSQLILQGVYTARSILQMTVSNGFNAIDGYRIFNQVYQMEV